MRLYNSSTGMRFSSLANKSIGPGSCTRELPVLTDFLSKLNKSSKGFVVRLSDDDVKALRAFVERAGARIDFGTAIEASRDPLGQGAIDDAINQRAIAIQAIKSKVIHDEREREARVNEESNYLDESGNPVARATAIEAEGGRKSIEPKIDEGMSDDIDSVMANNMAIMSGKKRELPESVRKAMEVDDVNDMRPGKSAVSKMTIPGVPNLPGIRDVAVDLAKEARQAETAARSLSSETKPTDSPYVVTSDSILKGFKRPSK